MLTTIGDHLRNRRFELRLMQREVAALLGVPPSTYPKWEDGTNVPRSTNRQRLAGYLGYDPFARPMGFLLRLAGETATRKLERSP